MSIGQGFTDLRMSRQDAESAEGFWPSFTDIMTVIVMIFLLAMVILLMRNMELVEQLRATMLAEVAAERKSDSLTDRLSALQRQLNQMQTQLTSAQVFREQQAAAISSLEQEKDLLLRENQQQSNRIAELNVVLESTQQAQNALRSEHQQLIAHRQAELMELDTLQSEKQRAQNALSAAQQSTQALEARLAGLTAELALLKQALENRTAALAAEQRLHGAVEKAYADEQQALAQLRRAQADLQTAYEQALTSVVAFEQQQQALDDMQQENQDLRQRFESLSSEAMMREQLLAQALEQLEQADLSLTTLEKDYGALNLKYNELVKPARIAEGRYVVEVRISKNNGDLRLLLRESKTEPFRRVTHSELESELRGLKRLHREGLYIRVIIPDDSGLSYKEAWGFTTEIHRKFDYYYSAGN